MSATTPQRGQQRGKTSRPRLLFRWLLLAMVVLAGAPLLVVLAVDQLRPVVNPPLSTADVLRVNAPSGDAGHGGRKSADPPSHRAFRKTPVADLLTEETIRRGRPIPDLTGLREDLVPAAIEWNHEADKATSAMLALFAESREMTYEEFDRRWYDLLFRRYGRPRTAFVNGGLWPKGVTYGSLSPDIVFMKRVNIAAAIEHEEWMKAAELMGEVNDAEGQLYCWRQAGRPGRRAILVQRTGGRIYSLFVPLFEKYDDLKNPKRISQRKELAAFESDRQAKRDAIWSGAASAQTPAPANQNGGAKR